MVLPSSLWLAVPVLAISSVLCLAAWQNPAERERERDLWTMCWACLFHNSASSVQATATAVWSRHPRLPKEQLGSTLFVCGCWSMDMFTSTHCKTCIYTYSYLTHLCASARLRTSVLSSHEGLILCCCTFTRLTCTVLTRCSADPVVDKLPLFGSLCLVYQGTRLRLTGVSGSWDLFPLW